MKAFYVNIETKSLHNDILTLISLTVQASEHGGLNKLKIVRL